MDFCKLKAHKSLETLSTYENFKKVESFKLNKGRTLGAFYNLNFKEIKENKNPYLE